MPAPPASARKCCRSYVGHPHHPTCTRKGGRPVTTGETPPRQAGRHGKIWDDCEQQAAADGQTMTAFVRDAITRELTRRRNIIQLPSTGPAVTATVWAGPPDHPDRGDLPLYQGPPLVQPIDIAAPRARVCSCDDDDCGGTCASSHPATFVTKGTR